MRFLSLRRIEVNKIGSEHCDLYRDFLGAMWPVYGAAGDWDTVVMKFGHNPHNALCEGSALYGAFHENTILAVAGAYAMPVLVKGRLHPGHVICDWAVIPRYKLSGAFGLLFKTLLALPGRKYVSSGNEHAQGLMVNRAVRIRNRGSLTVLDPLMIALAKLTKVRAFALPAPFHMEEFNNAIAGMGQSLSPPKLREYHPGDTDNVAFVPRWGDFWSVYCRYRHLNGAVCFRIKSGSADAEFVVAFTQAGRFRFADVLATSFFPPCPENGQAAGRSVRRLMRKLGVSLVSCEGTDPILTPFLNGLGGFCRFAETTWWSVPKEDDAFSANDVEWRLAQADRDSHWGYVVPSHGGYVKSVRRK